MKRGIESRPAQVTEIHPAVRRFSEVRIVAGMMVDNAIAKAPHTTEAERETLAQDLTWTLLCIRFGIGGEPRVVWGNFTKTINSFGKPKEPKI